MSRALVLARCRGPGGVDGVAPPRERPRDWTGTLGHAGEKGSERERERERSNRSLWRYGGVGVRLYYWGLTGHRIVKFILVSGSEVAVVCQYLRLR